MRRYWAFYKISLLNTLAYRGPIVVWLSSNLITLATITAAWLAVSATGLIGGYTKGELITYYIFALFLQWLTAWFPYYWIKDDIATGDIVGSTLLKPLSFYIKAFAQEAGWHSVSLFVGLFAAIIISFFLKNFFVFNLDTVGSLFLAGAIAVSIILTYTLSMCMGMICFWTTKVGPLDSFFWICQMLFGGQSLPISFFPESIRVFVYCLPFRYMFSFPIEIYLGKLSTLEIFQGFLMGLFWLFLLVLLYKLLWSRGRLAYTSFGN